MLFPSDTIKMQQIEAALLFEKQVSLSILRLDEIHPVVSGNKMFKLHFYLKEALEKSMEGILTFGGAYSNHLLATAFSCRESGLKAVGIIRGDQPAGLSHSLQQCMEYGMHLVFVSRDQYSKKDAPEFLNELRVKYKNYLIVPEGGYHPIGAAGAALIMNFVDKQVTHICSASGTATTIAGLLAGAGDSQQIVGFPVLKGLDDINDRLLFLTGRSFSSRQLQIIDGYHFGGYAKKTPELIAFMNDFFERYNIPTDFVYTGKMMFGVMDCIRKNLFAAGSRLVCLHTGGLQGNGSLPSGALIF
jgi:1-aminocyclopropane-1-carboxylate deaminase